MSGTSDEDEIPLSEKLTGISAAQLVSVNGELEENSEKQFDSDGDEMDESVALELEEEFEDEDDSSESCDDGKFSNTDNGSEYDLSRNGERNTEKGEQGLAEWSESSGNTSSGRNHDTELLPERDASDLGDGDTFEERSNSQPLQSSQEQHSVSEDDSDDDIPLSSRKVRIETSSVSRDTEKAEDAMSDDSDDDLPLASRLVANKSISNVPSADKKISKRGVRNSLSKSESKLLKVKKVAKDEAVVIRRKRVKNEVKKQKVKLSRELETSNRKFELPGQRREVPATNDPLRLFYESMYKERLTMGKPSALAETWMMHHGLLDAKTASKVFASRRK